MSEYIPKTPETIPSEEEFFTELAASAFYIRQVADNQLVGGEIESLSQSIGNVLNWPNRPANRGSEKPNLVPVPSADMTDDPMDWIKPFTKSSTLYLHRIAASCLDTGKDNQENTPARMSIYTDFNILYRSVENSLDSIGIAIDDQTKVDIVRWYGVSFVLARALNAVGLEHESAILVGHQDWRRREVEPRSEVFRHNPVYRDYINDRNNQVYDNLRRLVSNEDWYYEGIQWSAYAHSLGLEYLYELLADKLHATGPIGISFEDLLNKIEIEQMIYICQYLADSNFKISSAKRLLSRVFSFRNKDLVAMATDNLYLLHMPDGDSTA